MIGGVVTVVDFFFLRETLYRPTDPLQEKIKPTTFRQKLVRLKFNPVSALCIMAYAFTAYSLPALSFIWHDTVFLTYITLIFII